MLLLSRSRAVGETPPAGPLVFDEDFPAGFVWDPDGASPQDGIEFIGSDTKLVTGRVVESDVAGNKFGIELPRVGIPGDTKGRIRWRANPAAGPWDDLNVSMEWVWNSQFDPAQGGTVFGLQSNEFIGGALPNGTSDGALAEVVWGATTAGNDFAGAVRIYHAGAIGGDGYDEVAFSTDFTKGATTKVEVIGFLNSAAGVADGIVTVKLNDSQVATKTNCTFYTTSEGNRTAHQWKGGHVDAKHEGIFHDLSALTSVTTAAGWKTTFQNNNQNIDTTWTEAQINTMCNASVGYPRSDGEQPISFGGAYWIRSFINQYYLTDNEEWLDRIGDMLDYWWTKRDTERDTGNWLSGSNRYDKAPAYFKNNDSVPFPAWPRDSGGWRIDSLRVGACLLPYAQYCEVCYQNRNVPSAHQTRAASIMTWLQECLDGTGAAHGGLEETWSSDEYGDGSVSGAYFRTASGFGNTGLTNVLPYNQSAFTALTGIIVSTLLGGDAIYDANGGEQADYLVTDVSTDTSNPWLTHDTGDNSYYWDYAPKDADTPLGPDNGQMEDVGHADTDVSFLIEAYKRSLGDVDLTDLQRFANTLTVSMLVSGTQLTEDVDGGGGNISSEGRKTIAHNGWLPLGEYDTDVLDLVVDVFEAHESATSNSKKGQFGWSNLVKWNFSSPNVQPAYSGPSLTLHWMRMALP